MAGVFDVFRRERLATDELPPRARAFAENENRRHGGDLAAERTRRVSSGLGGVWLTGAQGQMCAIRNFGGVATGIACDSASQILAGNPLIAISPAPNDVGWDIWGAAPDSLTVITAIQRPGARKSLPISENGFATRLPRIPVALTWRSADGHQHFYDTTRVPCGPSKRLCVQLPDPVRSSSRPER